MSVTKGTVAVTFHRTGEFGDSLITGSNGQTFFLQRPCGQLHFKWTMFTGGKEGIATYSLASAGRGLVKSFVVESLKDKWTVEMASTGLKQYYTRHRFAFEGRNYVWLNTWEGFHLIEAHEEGLKKQDRTVLVKFKKRTIKKSSREIRLYEAGLHLPTELILLTGFVMEALFRQTETIPVG